MSAPNAARALPPSDRDDAPDLPVGPALRRASPISAGVALEVDAVRQKLVALAKTAQDWEPASRQGPVELAQATASLAKAAEEARAAVAHLARTVDATVSREQRTTRQRSA